MRIGVNSLFLIPGEVGGSETYLLSTLPEMAYRADHELVVFTNVENDALLRGVMAGVPGVSFVETGIHAVSRVSRIRCEQLCLPRLARGAGIDVLWSPGYTAPLRCHVPRVTSVLDMQYRRFPKDFGFASLAATWLLVGLAARHSEALIAISEFSRSEIIRFTGANPARVHVTPLAADGKFFTQVFSGSFKAERLMRLTRCADPFILAVSNTYPHKDMAAAVMAFGRIMDGIPHRLVIVGQPRRDEPSVEAAVNALSSKGRVARLYRVDRTDLAVLYQCADLFVFPSLYEGFGLPVLEAMVAGVPVVASGCGAIAEIGGDAIEIVEPGSPSALAASMMKALQWNEGQRRRRITRAQRRAATFSWGRTAQETLRVCESAAMAREAL